MWSYLVAKVPAHPPFERVEIGHSVQWGEKGRRDGRWERKVSMTWFSSHSVTAHNLKRQDGCTD